MKKAAVFLLALFVWGIFQIPVWADGAPSVSAKSAVLIDADSGAVLYGKGENTRRGMASTTKIMTALVALERISLDTLVTVDPAACGVEGSSVYLFPEEEIKMETLLYALMLQSANDAAEAIAYAVSGSLEGFVALMNEKAEAIGLSDTHFENPHGLDGERHYTTALELARITAEALQNETFRTIVATKKTAIPLHNGEATRLLVNHNRLLREYDDIIGVKTGYTRACGRTLVSAAVQNGKTLICVTLDDGDDWRDHRALLDYGFSLFQRETLLAIGELAIEVPVCGGEKPSIFVTNADEVTALLPKEHGKIRMTVELPRFLYGGIERGEVIGSAHFFDGKTEVGCLPLVATDTVGQAPKKQSFSEKILSFFGINR